MIRVIVFAFSLLLVLFFSFFAYMGAFSKVEVTREEVGPFNFIYIERKGDYAKTGDAILKASKALESVGIKNTNGYGYYLDNPDKVRKEDCRSEAGIVLSDEEYEKSEKLLNTQFKFKKVEKFDSLVARVPFKNPLSITIGVVKAYPALGEYSHVNGLNPQTSLEFYEFGKQITYVMPLKELSSKQ